MDEHLDIPPQTPNNGEPEKYIRTFEGDMETLQGGGVPDLTPLAEAPGPSERLVAPSPLEPTPSFQLQNPISEPPLPVHTAPQEGTTPLETYADDFSQRMKKTNASVTTVLAAEQDSAPSYEPEEAPRKLSRSSILYSIAGATLLIIGGVGAYLAYSSYSTANAPVTPTASVSAPIFVDGSEQVSGTGTALLQSVEQSVAQPLTPGTIRLLYLASTTSGSVFGALPLSAPDILVRNVNTDGSMAGVINVNGTGSPFFILSVSSYSNTFAGMLAWETTMPRSLSGLFPAYPPLSVSTTTTATTTMLALKKSPQASSTPQSATVVPMQQLSFLDEVVDNHDVRVYHDGAGRSVLLYGYWNQSTLVIARDPAAFTAILGRLATSRTP